MKCTVWKLENFLLTQILREINLDDGKSQKLTMLKFLDFSISQILHKINFGDSRSAKSAISTNLETVNFDVL